MSRPTPIQSTKTTHSSSFRVSRTPMSSTRPKPIVDTEAKQRRCSLIFQGTGKAAKRYHPEGVLMTTQTLVGTYHRARYWAVPEKQGHPWPTGPWSVSCSGSCGRLSVVTWTSKASATGRIQSPFVWNGAAVEGTYSALLLPCDVQHHAYWGRRCFAAKWSATWCWRSGWKSMWNKGGKDKNGGLRRRKTGWTAVHIHFHLETNVNAIFWDYNFITRCVVPILKCNLCTLCCRVNLPDNSCWWTLSPISFKRRVNLIWINCILKIYTQSQHVIVVVRKGFSIPSSCCLLCYQDFIFFSINFIR